MPIIPHTDDNWMDVEAVFVLAQQAEAFFKSEIGHYVAVKAYEESEAAKNALTSVSPKDTKKIIELQIKFKAATLAIQFLNEKLREARLARDEEIVNQDTSVEY